jgi:hypothetical protein
MADNDYQKFLEVGIQAIGLVIPAVSAAAPIVRMLIAAIDSPDKKPTPEQWAQVNAIIQANSQELQEIVARDKLA